MQCFGWAGLVREISVSVSLFDVLLHPRTDVPIPSALFAPLRAQGRNDGHSPQRGE